MVIHSNSGVVDMTLAMKERHEVRLLRWFEFLIKVGY